MVSDSLSLKQGRGQQPLETERKYLLNKFALSTSVLAEVESWKTVDGMVLILFIYL